LIAFLAKPYKCLPWKIKFRHSAGNPHVTPFLLQIVNIVAWSDQPGIVVGLRIKHWIAKLESPALFMEAIEYV
jgi:hypothetical protein